MGFVFNSFVSFLGCLIKKVVHENLNPYFSYNFTMVFVFNFLVSLLGNLIKKVVHEMLTRRFHVY